MNLLWSFLLVLSVTLSRCAAGSVMDAVKQAGIANISIVTQPFDR